MADGTTLTDVGMRIFRAPTVADAAQDFLTAAVNPAAHDVETLDEMAEVIADACRKLEPLFAKLDAARATVDAAGFARRDRLRWRATEVDAYAVVESLFWGDLTGEAETLFKAQVQAALSSQAGVA